MVKFVVFAAVVAAILAVFAAVGEAERNINLLMRGPFRGCQREVQESPINACRELVEQRLADSFKPTPGTRMRCCQQLRDVSFSCRCAAIRRMVYDYEEGMRQVEAGQEGSYGGADPQILQPAQQVEKWSRAGQETAPWGPVGQQGQETYGTGQETAPWGTEGQQGQGSYGTSQETAPWGPVGQQGQETYGTGQETAPWGTEGQQGQGSYGTSQETAPWGLVGQQGQETYGTGQETAPWGTEGQQGQGSYGTSQETAPWEVEGQQGQGTYDAGSAGTGKRLTSVQLRRARQYSAQLPMLCRIEPQYCRIFGGGEN